MGSEIDKKQNAHLSSTVDPKLDSRLQDAPWQALNDQGRCLSMHQPYASLLVRGIKK